MNIPMGVMLTEQELQRAAGVDGREWHRLTTDANCPPMPPQTRCYGQVVYAADLARAWLREFAAFRRGMPALEAHRDAERQRYAAERAAQRQAIEQGRIERTREMHDHFRSVERSNELAREGKDPRGTSWQPLGTGGSQ